MRGHPGDNAAVDPTWTRLEDQIEWYDQRGAEAQRAYRRHKVAEIVLVASIPFLAGFQDNLAATLAPGLAMLPALAIAAVGVAVIIIEALLHLNQYYHTWVTYRATSEALMREKFLFLAAAGPYADVEDKLLFLAERVEGLIAQEPARWAAARDRGYRARRAA